MTTSRRRRRRRSGDMITDHITDMISDALLPVHCADSAAERRSERPQRFSLRAADSQPTFLLVRRLGCSCAAGGPEVGGEPKKTTQSRSDSPCLRRASRYCSPSAQVTSSSPPLLARACSRRLAASCMVAGKSRAISKRTLNTSVRAALQSKCSTSGSTG